MGCVLDVVVGGIRVRWIIGVGHIARRKERKNYLSKKIVNTCWHFVLNESWVQDDYKKYPKVFSVVMWWE